MAGRQLQAQRQSQARAAAIPDMRGMNALEGPEAGGLDFGAMAATVLEDASNEIVPYKDRLGRTRESRFDQPPAEVQIREELIERHPSIPPGMTDELDIQSINAMKRAAGEEDPRYANEAGMRNREAAMYRGVESEVDVEKPRGWVDGTGDLNIGQWGTGSPNTQGQMALDPTFAGGLRGAGLGAEVTPGETGQEGGAFDWLTKDTELGDSPYTDTMIEDQITEGATADQAQEDKFRAQESSPGQEVATFLEEAARPPRGGGPDVMEVSESVTETGPAVKPPRGWRDPDKALENVPFEETKHGFSARDYALEGLKNPPMGPAPLQEAGSTGWIRRQYPWARNMSEEMLVEVAHNPDLLRYMEGRDGTRAPNRAPVEEVNVMGTGEIQPIINDLVEKARIAQEQSWEARFLLKGVDLDRFASGTYSQEDVFRLYERFSKYKDRIMSDHPDVWESFMKVIEATR